MATDNGDPAQTTSVIVQININDINEFDPQFGQSLYNVSGLAFNDTLPGACACVCMYVYIYYTCMCVCVCACVYVCQCVYACMYNYMYMCACACL